MTRKEQLMMMFRLVTEAWREIDIDSDEALWLVEAFIDEAFEDVMK